MERSAGMVLLLHGCDQEHSDDAAHELVFSRMDGKAGPVTSDTLLCRLQPSMTLCRHPVHCAALMDGQRVCC